jgi:hypothetical protein
MTASGLWPENAKRLQAEHNAARTRPTMRLATYLAQSPDLRKPRKIVDGLDE